LSCAPVLFFFLLSWPGLQFTLPSAQLGW
jgi:hypothetical protein